jgi:hypothetical protein
MFTISLLTQLLEQIAKHQHEIKALSNNQIKIQPQTSDSYTRIINALVEKRTFTPSDQKKPETTEQY